MRKLPKVSKVKKLVNEALLTFQSLSILSADVDASDSYGYYRCNASNQVTSVSRTIYLHKSGNPIQGECFQF